MKPLRRRLVAISANFHSSFRYHLSVRWHSLCHENHSMQSNQPYSTQKRKRSKTRCYWIVFESYVFKHPWNTSSYPRMAWSAPFKALWFILTPQAFSFCRRYVHNWLIEITEAFFSSFFSLSFIPRNRWLIAHSLGIFLASQHCTLVFRIFGTRTFHIVVLMRITHQIISYFSSIFISLWRLYGSSKVKDRREATWLFFSVRFLPGKKMNRIIT